MCSRLTSGVIVISYYYDFQKLAGTIYTAAKEIEEAGGRALALAVDVRDEESVKAAVAKAVSQ